MGDRPTIPTPEQTNCVDQAKTGKRLAVKAYAGTGKTTTCVSIAKSTMRKGLHVAFGAAIAAEAKKKFPVTVECKTGHGLANKQFRAMQPKYVNKELLSTRMVGNLTAAFVASKMRIKGIAITDDFHITPNGMAFLATAAAKRFMQSGRREITPRDVRLEGRLDLLDDAKMKNEIIMEAYGYAKKLWERICDPRDDMPMTHDGYLKQWALTNPQIDADYILLDEAQDTNGVMLELMRIQQAQMICVGDSHQSIYEWRGALDAMTLLPSDVEARLTTSFRFGTEVADYATRVLNLLGETVPLRGNPTMKSTLAPIDGHADAVLFRGNAQLLEQVFATVELGRRPMVLGGVRGIIDLLEGAAKLQAGIPVEWPLEFFGFANWQEVQDESRKPEGAELKQMVDTIDKYGVQVLKDVLTRLPKDEASADLVLATSHQSKGREWHKVRIAEGMLRGIAVKDWQTDRTYIEPTDDMGPELRLYYVAATRGQHQLDIHPNLLQTIERLEKGAQMKAEGTLPARPDFHAQAAA